MVFCCVSRTLMLITNITLSMANIAAGPAKNIQNRGEEVIRWRP